MKNSPFPRQSSAGWFLALPLPLLFMQPLTAQEPAEDSSQLYATLCASCHSADLRGARGPDLLDEHWIHGDAPDTLASVIRDGVPERGMPGFAEVLSAEQVRQLVQYIETTQASDTQETSSGVTAPLETLDYAVEVSLWATGLTIPWGLAFTGPDTALVTERPGRLRLIHRGTIDPEPIQGTPQVHYPEGTQGGLLDIALHPDYENNGWIYLAYSAALEQKEGEEHAPSMLKVVRGRIRDHRWVDEQIVFDVPVDAYPASAPYHYGGRLAFDHAGYLYVSVGDRYQRAQAQDLSLPNGKIHRLLADGSIPGDNPFVGRANALSSIYSYGHRNPQGLALEPATGALWALEHGPKGGDELNRPEGGRNYGWPVISYGINYDGTVLTPHRRRLGMEQPVRYWRPSIAVSGATFYDGDLFPRWRGKLLTGSLKYETLQLLDVEQDRVMHEETLMQGRGRVREIVTGPEGAIYILMHEPGHILRLTPLKERLR